MARCPPVSAAAAAAVPAAGAAAAVGGRPSGVCIPFDLGYLEVCVCCNVTGMAGRETEVCVCVFGAWVSVGDCKVIGGRIQQQTSGTEQTKTGATNKGDKQQTKERSHPQPPALTRNLIRSKQNRCVYVCDSNVVCKCEKP